MIFFKKKSDGDALGNPAAEAPASQTSDAQKSPRRRGSRGRGRGQNPGSAPGNFQQKSPAPSGQKSGAAGGDFRPKNPAQKSAPRGRSGGGVRPPAHARGKKTGPSTPLVRGENRDPAKFETAGVYGNPFPRDKNAVLRVIPLGGVEDTTKNLVALECGEDIFVIDCGIAFPTEDMPGVDKLIPDVAWLEKNLDRVRGMVITHGHMDHFGSIPWIVPKLGGEKLPIFAPELAGEMILAQQEEFGGKLNLSRYDHKSFLKFGKNFAVEFYRVAHNVPDSHGVVIHTPAGTLVHTGDWKFDHSPPGKDAATDVAKIAELGARGVDGVLSDSTNAYNPGYQKSELEIMKELEKIFQQNTQGRLIATLFSSHLGRVHQLIELAAKYGRRVVTDGMSMKKNVEISKRLGYIDAPESLFVDRTDFKKLRPSEVLAILPGAGGQEESAMARVARGEHAHIFVEPGDTAIFTSSVVPGTARMVERIKDEFYRRGAHVIDYYAMDIHAGGHARQEDIKMFYRMLRPRAVAPFFGNYSHRVDNGELAVSVGIAKENIFIVDEGNILEFRGDGTAGIAREKIETRLLAVDGLALGEIGGEVISDRQKLARGGIFTMIFTLGGEGLPVAAPEIVSRGFVFVKENRELIRQAAAEAEEAFRAGKRAFPDDDAEMKFFIKKRLEKFLLKMTDREPLVVPVLIQA